MDLIDAKLNRKSYIEGTGYQPSMRNKLYIDDNGTIFEVDHLPVDIAAAEQTLSIHGSTETVILQGISMSHDKASNITLTAKILNEQLYNHLWDKYAEIDSATSITAVDTIVWEMDTNLPVEMHGI